MKSKTYLRQAICLLAWSIICCACSDLYNLPDDKDFLSEEINYSNKVLEPTLGRTSVFSSLNLQNSTTPLKFEIVNARYGDGRPVDDIFMVKSAYEWIAEYNGKETSIEEIEKKRRLVERPMFEVDDHGRLILWNSSNNESIEPRPKDTVLKTHDIRFFDLKVTNTGGMRIIKDFQIIPWRELKYSPNHDINPYTGGVAPHPKYPKDPKKRNYLTPSWMNGIVGEKSNSSLINNDDRKDVVVYIQEYEGTGNQSTIRFKFMDKDGQFMNPKLFNETKWDQLVHGFNLVFNEEYVQYDVAYPMPLVAINTPYVNGNNATVKFAYSRLGWGGGLVIADFGMNFQIHRAGNWEMIFHFTNDNPKFDNE